MRYKSLALNLRRESICIYSHRLVIINLAKIYCI
jgi:hypothetical protein